MSSSDGFSPTYESFVPKSRPKKTLKCDYNECHKQFATLSLMDSHKRREHAVSPLPTTRVPTVCPPIHRCLVNGCGLEFAGEYTLRAHQRAVHKDPTPVMSCETSGGGNDSAVGLTADPTHTASRFVCNKCDIIFVTGKGLNSHRRKCHSRTGKLGVQSAAAKQHDCAHDGCGQSYPSKRKLQKHMRCVHSATGGQYRCDDCIQRFYHQFKLDKHRLTAHSKAAHVPQESIEPVVNVPPVHPAVGKKYRCGRCAKRFYLKYGRDQHCLAVHSAATRVLQTPIETEVNVPSVPMETTLPESVPIAPATVQSVTQSLRPSLRYCPNTVITEPNNR
ncbi:unnamed protein product [Medioppia subpectinata]|uniref:C2H2-type domain-containing protein n=1 Tax=Medioppia subpectinata TaxID=1979941 RepID=A0A7R9LSJ3_9ACAR|nr:unnamed protein product [Medioppia subpectinata]CAG2121037.1 unnamed protein product [Medioppia subpectinata]